MIYELFLQKCNKEVQCWCGVLWQCVVASSVQSLACVCVCALWFLQGRVVRRGADELSPESEERGGGSQPEHAGVHRDGQNPAGCSKPGS